MTVTSASKPTARTWPGQVGEVSWSAEPGTSLSGPFGAGMKGRPVGGDSAAQLIGRDLDVEFVCGFVDEAAARGGALLVSGDAGVGKTALLDVAVLHAEAAGTRVVRAVGAEFEAELGFSGLNVVLHPLLDGLPMLPPLHRQALSVALGLDAGSPSDRLVVSNAVLALLRDAAATRPLLVVVDDLQWPGPSEFAGPCLGRASPRWHRRRILGGFADRVRELLRSCWTAQLRDRAARRSGRDVLAQATVPRVDAARSRAVDRRCAGQPARVARAAHRSSRCPARATSSG